MFVYVPFLLLGVCLGATVREAMHFHGGIYGFIVATIFFALFSARAEVSYDRSCRAPYRGFLMHAAQAGG